MQRFRAGQETDANLQGSQDINCGIEKIQAQIILLLKVYNVGLFIFSFVDYPVTGLDLTELVINPNLPHQNK